MKSKKIYLTTFILILMTLMISTIYAGSSINVSSQNVEIGQNITVTVTVSDVAAWNISISSSGPIKFISGTLKSADATEDAGNATKTISAVFQATGEGTAKFTLNGDTTTAAGANSSISGKSANVSIKQKTVTPPPSQNPSTGTSSGGNTTNPSNNTKSSNAYLKNLQINQEGLNPNFSKTKYSYSLTVNKSVENIKVTAVTEDSKAKVSVSGNNNLKDGDNIISVVVTAENGSTKTYKITVTRTADAEASNAYLENLIIENAKLTTDFESAVLEYTLEKVSANINKLDIKAFPKVEEATVRIEGNDNLVDGENIIKIIVTSTDGQTIREYIIKFEREVSAAATINPSATDNDSQKNNLANTEGFLTKLKIWYNSVIEAIVNNPLLFILYGFVLVEFIQILYLFSKVKKLNKKVVEIDKENNLDGELVYKDKTNTQITSNINDNKTEKFNNNGKDNLLDQSNKIKNQIVKPSENDIDQFINDYKLKKENGLAGNKQNDFQDEVVVKSIDFNTSYDPTTFASRKTTPQPRSTNSYDDYMKEREEILKKKQMEDNDIDNLDI